MDSLVFLHMQYALPVWGPSLYQHYLQRLQRLQHRAVRLIFSLHKIDHVSKHYKQLQWLDFDQPIQFHLVCVMFHQYHRSKGILLSPPIEFGNHTPYCTRTQPHLSILINVDYHNLNSFFGILLATSYWNNLALHMKQITSFNEFPSAIKDNLLNS